MLPPTRDSKADIKESERRLGLQTASMLRYAFFHAVNHYSQILEILVPEILESFPSKHSLGKKRKSQTTLRPLTCKYNNINIYAL